MAKRIGKMIAIAFAVLFSLVVLAFAVSGIGKTVRGQTPEGGVNESGYVQINGTRQWISVYGQNKANPILLYLHGGPGEATSDYDYAFTRKWSDVYTVVTWDQRNCGKSYRAGDNTRLTYDLFMRDGQEMTEYLLRTFQKEKITLLGHSWGAYYGANLALSYPQFYDAFIGAGQLVDVLENERAFQEIATEWVGEDKEGLELLRKLTPNRLTKEHFGAKNRLMERYGYDLWANERDYNIFFARAFNPYYSVSDWVKGGNRSGEGYMDFILSEEFLKFDLSARLRYEVPYFTINGDRDYQTNYLLAQAYYEKLSAPQKGSWLMEDTTHGLLETRSEAFSAIVHEIHGVMRTANA